MLNSYESSSGRVIGARASNVLLARAQSTAPWTKASFALVPERSRLQLSAISKVLQPAKDAGKWMASGSATSEGLPILRLLVLDEDAAVREACIVIAERMGFSTVQAASPAQARTLLQQGSVDLILMDLRAPASKGLGSAVYGGSLLLLEEVKTLYPASAVIVMTAFATVPSAVEAMRLGARDYLTKPFALEELSTVLRRAAERMQVDVKSRRLQERLRSGRGSGPLMGSSPEMEKLFRILSKVAHSAHPVLIQGESGTGKELIARSIHFGGTQSAKPFIAVDCGSLAPELLERELFGTPGEVSNPERGRNGKTDASMRGLLTMKSGGTIFLDEISELPLDLQARLARTLQDKHVGPGGSAAAALPLTVRVLAGTNRDLSAMVEQGKFRKDLYFRVNVVSLRIPPLRDRKDDIPELAQHFLDRLQREADRPHALSNDALAALVEYDWPGNVRELESALERACAFSSGPILQRNDLPTQLQPTQRMKTITHPPTIPARAAIGSASMAELEKQAIFDTIRQTGGDKLMAAKLLRIGKTTLYRKLKEYGNADGTLHAC